MIRTNHIYTREILFSSALDKRVNKETGLQCAGSVICKLRGSTTEFQMTGRYQRSSFFTILTSINLQKFQKWLFFKLIFFKTELPHIKSRRSSPGPILGHNQGSSFFIKNDFPQVIHKICSFFFKHKFFFDSLPFCQNSQISHDKTCLKLKN